MQKHILFTQKIRRYQGSYVAVAREKIIARGKDAREAYHVAQKILGKKRKVEGVYYVPQKKDLLTALCVSPISS